MAAALQHSFLSLKSAPQKGVSPFVLPWTKPAPRCCTMAVSIQNIFNINISVNSQQVRQQTSSGPEITSKNDDVSAVLAECRVENGSGGDGSNGRLPPSGGGGGGGGGCGGGRGEDGKDFDEERSRTIMNLGDAMREAETRRTILPSDMVEAAKTEGIRSEYLNRFFDLQMVVTDSCSATYAEFQKKGKDFLSEFKINAADLLVAATIDVALVGMLAPYARMGTMPSVSAGFFGQLRLAFASLPSSVFEAGSQGLKFSLQQRIATFFYKGILFAAVGFGCGLVFHGIAYLFTTGNRNTKKSEEDAPVSLVKRAALWGVFLAVSANTRYQIISGLEQFVQSSPLAKQAPSVALAFTVGIRFANNIYGGLQFEDWAKWSGMMKRES